MFTSRLSIQNLIKLTNSKEKQNISSLKAEIHKNRMKQKLKTTKNNSNIFEKEQKQETITKIKINVV